jgi:hypothetical protein
MTTAEIQTLVDDAVAKLREHCDSVQIFVTVTPEDGSSDTWGCESGKGNFYARQGQIDEWLGIQRQYQKNYAKRLDRKQREEEGLDSE